MDNYKTSLRTLERGLDVLDCFTKESLNLSLTEITEITGLNPSTAFRILTTLEKRDYLKRDQETKKYKLGDQILSLHHISISESDLISIAKPYMQELFDRCQESVSIYLPIGENRLCLERIETKHMLGRVINVGESLPINKGAGGKALLAWLSKKDLNLLSKKGLEISEEELKEIRKKGYAISFGEREPGVVAIAAPIFNSKNELVAALSVAAPEVRFGDDVIEKLIPLIKEGAKKITAKNR